MVRSRDEEWNDSKRRRIEKPPKFFGLQKCGATVAVDLWDLLYLAWKAPCFIGKPFNYNIL